MASRITLNFTSLSAALLYCRQKGLGYEIEYPRKRYHQAKDYAKNFKWKGPPEEQDEDIA